VGISANYIASAAHYDAIARRVMVALRRGSRPLALVTGDPPANPQLLCDALRNVAGPEYAVMIISCGPELRREDLERTVPSLAKAKAIAEAEVQPGYRAAALPLFVFFNFDRLTERQIEDIFGDTSRRNELQRAAVLLTPPDFLTRLEQPALRFLKNRIVTQFQFHEVGNGEAITVLHNQLLAQRDRRVEARGFRHGILIGLSAGGVAIAATIGAFILYPTAEQVREAPASNGQSSLVNQQVSMLRPAAEAPQIEAAANVGANSVIMTPPPPPSALPTPTIVENPPPIAVPSATVPPTRPRLSDAEITALLARGYTFLGAGDITSARPFYERAAEAESGLAAFQLGATFDPVFSGRAANRVQALFWYRRARDLGVGEAEQRIKALEPASIVAQEMRGRRTRAEGEREPVLGDLLNLRPAPVEPTIAYPVDEPRGQALSAEPGTIPTGIGEAMSAPSPDNRASAAARPPSPTQASHPSSFRKPHSQKLASSRTLPAHPPTRAIRDVLHKHPDLLK
jgi:hypothetical protein